MTIIKTLHTIALGCALTIMLLLQGTDLAASQSKQQKVVDDAVQVLKNFSTDENGSFFRKTLQDAKAVLIVPVMFKGGIILGGSTGEGALLFHNEESNTWSYPVFYSISSISFGLLAGLETSQLILVVMTQKGVEALQDTSFQLGFDITAAAGPYGAGAKAATADILSYAKSKGIYGGVSLEGAKISVLPGWNRRYYQKTVSPADFIKSDAIANNSADPLREAIEKLTNE